MGTATTMLQCGSSAEKSGSKSQTSPAKTHMLIQVRKLVDVILQVVDTKRPEGPKRLGRKRLDGAGRSTLLPAPSLSRCYPRQLCRAVGVEADRDGERVRAPHRLGD